MADERDERLAHLGMIQAVITRMAEESARMKQFALAAIGVLASTAAGTHSAALAYVAGALSVIFWLLDARYLQQERWYRALFDQIRADTGPTDFCMAPNAQIRQRHALIDTLRGWSVAPLYGTLVIIALLVAQTVGTLATPTS
ncbi:hypothetical protein [Rhodospirillum rubrum]|uniref:Uncharacterized protein n=1 Tax=Rhodospirillum rubrum (strain ATCC 11170 / ATH 1.1.1 / DSM 467 / LMG 4362 / NCIMB 8255 / S1) TaxID=269796 RepID=Q2RW58_RHORT|nr:hypothetical protein [Rhodospirillum rubrum]ABC21637.1 hypothetical protein Rru_A0836 [Rhodospirillum rubrum ATCC 11170]AEO47331.1 hypothetical protein F11_04305 [Rhodospirillum rubrum F11]QXG81303.1 hypothetical protein KUL73_04365 [Rhodospirillum rubrum]HAQ00213.1 hypothetical protein [Rhodospirillum rubrum]HCF17409.1 hypothetical protein [Rhodospirillum rubrum]